MKFVSTRGHAEPLGFSQAVLQGLAPDGGLYVPSELMPQDFTGATTLREVAERLLAPFLEEDPLASSLQEMLAQAFTFDAPLVPTKDSKLQVLELFHGPTAAFKDFGARFLAQCVQRLGTSQARTVLVATSGDTGGAVASAFHGLPGVRVAILYPKGLVSPRQAHQLGAFGDNVRAFSVGGTFDDCQRVVKAAFADVALREKRPLVSANSISLARLLPQAAYYAHAALVHQRAHGEPLSVAVPSGNLGNGLACLLARAMGLPLGDVVLASNANRALVDSLAAGHLAAHPSIATLANAMDVGAPSNFERLTWLGPRRVTATAVDDETIRARVREGEARYGHVWCPHTACAVEAVERRRAQGDSHRWAVVATAHPAKFETVVEPLVGHPVPPPPALAEVLARPSESFPLEATLPALVEALDAWR